jgi:formylglycine-generating enzyme required for sulfatase activity
MKKTKPRLVWFPTTGPFVMGSEPDRDPYFWGAEGPPHNVTLKSYWIYQIG